MTDKARNGGTNKPANRTATADQVGTKPGARSAQQAHGVAGEDNGKAPIANSGLDVSGQFRVGERISIGVRGADIVLTQSHSGREVVVAEAALAGLLNDTYFVDKVD